MLSASGYKQNMVVISMSSSLRLSMTKKLSDTSPYAVTIHKRNTPIYLEYKYSATV